MIGYFKNDVYKTTNSCTSCTTSTTSSTNIGHKLKYTDQNANCSCADYDDYKIQTTTQNTPMTSNDTSSYFSRKWSSTNCC